MWYVPLFDVLLFDCFILMKETYNACASVPCLNNGVCTVIGNSYQCTCSNPYYGTNCQYTTGNKNLKQKQVFQIHVFFL